VITPRATRLVRAPDLRALQRALIRLVETCARGVPPRTAIVLPTRSAADELQRTLLSAFERPGAEPIALPDLLTRDELYCRLAERLPGNPPALTAFDREVLFRLSARAAERAGTRAPFRLRPGLIVEMLGFYDELRRNHRSVDDFDRLMRGELEPVADTDRGAERLLRQAEFLAAAFAEFQKRIASSGGIDEHGLRLLLLEKPVVPTYEQVVVAVADRAAEPHGLWTADFDLLARLPGLARLDVVATERVLAAGFHQRLHEHHLPGIEDVITGDASKSPALDVPVSKGEAAAALTHTFRDREEELVGIARAFGHDGEGELLDRKVVVFQRPLPYLYLAQQVLGSAGIPYQATDSLPLAGEPVVAGLDLAFAFLGSEGTRASMVELLGSPQWRFEDPVDGRPIGRADVSALDAFLRETKYLGGWERLRETARRAGEQTVGGPDSRSGRAAGALRAAAAAADGLAGIASASRASEQILALERFVARYELVPRAEDPWQARHLRARAAVADGLRALRQAHERHDDEPVPVAELMAAIRRWIEGQTFTPRTGTNGLRLMDATTAIFADADVVRIVGLVEGDWPERSSKSIFFPAKLLEPLGWAGGTDRLAAARARFQDLLRLPAVTVGLSTFSLEDDAIVAPSAFADEIGESGLVLHQTTIEPIPRLFDYEALSMDPVDSTRVTGDAARWLAFREQLGGADLPRFHGEAGPRAPGVYAVSRVERYLECPFKYFAAHVLRLDEERAEESGLTPQERGMFLHTVFEKFFAAWHEAGRASITAETLEEALAVFETVAEGHLAGLRESDRALERTHLLGSAVAPGLAERAFAFEIEHGVEVIERLLEHELEGAFVFRGAEGPRQVNLRAKADRIDLLADGSARIVDYKIGRAPKLSRSLQLPVYSTCASQQLAGRHGREWPVSRAGYVAFREKNAFVSLGVNLEKALAEGEQRLVAAVTSIEAGSFPPRPEDPWLCSRCGFASVCRKDYVGDD
jgi:RecB family exonuclease